MATRNEIVQQLRDAGYDGPVSYSKSRLEEILAGVVGGAATETEPPAKGEQAIPQEDTPEGSQEPERVEKEPYDGRYDTSQGALLRCSHVAPGSTKAVGEIEECPWCGTNEGVVKEWTRTSPDG